MRRRKLLVLLDAEECSLFSADENKNTLRHFVKKVLYNLKKPEADKVTKAYHVYYIQILTTETKKIFVYFPLATDLYSSLLVTHSSLLCFF